MSESSLSLSEATALLTAPGQRFETERALVDGMEMTVWKNAPGNLRDVLDLSLRYGSDTFLVYRDERVTFDQHYRVAATFAHRLVELGVEHGDRVAIASRNLPSWVSGFWGAVVAGSVVVPLNAWWTVDELAYGLLDSGTSVLLVDEERLERVRPLFDTLTNLRTVIVLREERSRPCVVGPAHDRVKVWDFEDLIGEVAADAVPPTRSIRPDDDVTIFYTSGTTGRPKGAVGTHRNLATNIMNLFFIGQRTALRFGEAAPDSSVVNAPTGNLLTIPLFHATGCLAVMLVNIAAGGKIVMMHHFEPRRALELIEAERLTNIGGVPTIVMQLLDHPDFAQFDTSSVRHVAYGGAPAPPELVRRIRAAFRIAQPSNGYGLTETSAAVALNNGPDYVAKPDSCGPALPVCDVAVVPEDFVGDEPPPDRPRGADITGELWIRGPNVVRGYWGKPEETAATFTRGWLHSGDVGRVDDEGFIYIVDRAKDMIIRGGENVYSVIVEAALFEHPDVADCAVVGLAHPTWGEEVAAVIVLRPGRGIEAEELSRHVAHRLAKFSVPTRYFFRAEPLPRNPQGKVLKRELRESLTALVDRSA